MKGIKIWLRFIILMIVFMAGDAFGCSCLHSRTVTVEDLWTNDLIFKGEVLSVKDIKDKSGWNSRKALFRINKLILSKSEQDTISVYTSAGVTSCGLYFREGETWLIFASGYKVFSASSCSNSRMERNVDTRKEIIQITHFFDSLQNGSHSVRQKVEDNGLVYELIGEIENGRPSGKWVKISGSDTIAWLNFRNGVQYGKQKDKSSPGGFEENAINYVDGEKIEIRRMYSMDRRMQMLMQFKNGELHGNYEMQFGNSKETGQYVDSKKEGEWINYRAGKVVHRRIYSGDELKESIRYDKEGNIIPK